MKLIALMPVRNEDWVLGLSARVALMWCDALVILLHSCTDRSGQIAQGLDREFGSERIGLLCETGEWDEMRHRQRMLETARTMRATHVAIIDADEILTGNLTALGLHPWVKGDWPPIALYEASPGRIVQLPGYNLRGLLHRYHASGIWSNRWFSVAFADDPRLHWAGDKFHAREPAGMKLQACQPIAQGQGGVMHLWGASERRLRAKHAWYKITERLRFPAKPVTTINEMYSWAIHGRPTFRDTPGRWTFADVPESWWAPYAHLMRYLDLDAEPWQEKAAREAVAEHGAARFAGLDLFGVA